MSDPLGKRRRVAIVLILAVLPYLNALSDGFTFDDGPVILQNPAVIEGLDVGRIFATPLFGRLYRPVTVLTYAVNQSTAAGQAWSFHATNILLHAVVSVLVLFLTSLLFDSTRVALAAAVLFAVHPIHTEAVTSIVGRAELLAALFGLAAILFAAAAETALSSSRRLLLRVASVLALPLAVMSKESAATVLPLIFLARIVVRRESFRSGVWRELRSGDWLIWGLSLLAVVWLRQQIVGGINQPSNEGASGLVPLSRMDNILAFVPAVDRVRSAVAVVWDYFGLLNVPLVLSADYSFDQVPIVQSWFDARWLAGALLVMAALATAILHPRPAVRFSVTLALLTLFVTANILFPIGTIKGERLLYLPSVGWAMLAGFYFVTLRRQPRFERIVLVVFCAVITLFAARVWRRNGDWADNFTLYRSMVQTSPRSAKARNNLGVALQLRGYDEAAIEQFEAALAIYPDAEASALGIGIVMERSGKIGEAQRWFDRAVAIRPDYLLAHGYRCAARLRAGDYAAAAAACRAGLRHQPANADLLKGLGFSLVGMNDSVDGASVLRRALNLNPADEEIRAYLERQSQSVRRLGLPVEVRG
ncbi:MAG: DUF1736 domain-containing protein [Deltaproteobacteria bacterium]|nr:DUF1736 domain-containing protein [Deltaproteobacteria bacterium]